MKFYTYVYYDPRKNPPEPFYVGKGSGLRLYDHLKESNILTIHNHKVHKIRKIQSSNLQPIISKVFETENEEDALELEEFLISEIGTTGISHLKSGPLVNIMPGGKTGSSGMVTVSDLNGDKMTVSTNDERFLNGELTSLSIGRCMVKDKYGNTMCTDKSDYRLLSGELQHIHVNEVLVKDSHGNKFWVSSDDVRYLNGELVGHTKGIKASNKTKNKMRKSGELRWEKITKQLCCPYCSICSRGIGTMHRFHFDNCKWNWNNASVIDKTIFQNPIWS